METILHKLRLIEHPTYLYSFSVLDMLFLKRTPPIVNIVTTATLIDLAKLFPSLDFPGMDDVDASIRLGETVVYFRSVDSLNELERRRILPLTFLYDIHRKVYVDTSDVYPTLRDGTIQLTPDFRFPFFWEEIGQLGVLLSRYHYTLPENIITLGKPYGRLSPDRQRIALVRTITGTNAANGLSFLEKSGFISEHWPELLSLNSIEHSKEYHPEGNVWEHTLATLSQRKTLDISLSLGLLLHDIGKTESERYEGKQFHRHAQIGSFSAVQFLRRLCFSEDIIEKVRYLVQYHMLPAAIDKLPLYKIEHILESPLFPLLLELFRCDLASSYRKLTKYYNACRAYKKYTKNRNNPFREDMYYKRLLPKSV